MQFSQIFQATKGDRNVLVRNLPLAEYCKFCFRQFRTAYDYGIMGKMQRITCNIKLYCCSQILEWSSRFLFWYWWLFSKVRSQNIIRYQSFMTGWKRT